MLGPNSPVGNYSVIAMSGVQGDYVLKLIDQWRQGQLQEVEATEEAKTRFNDYLKQGMGNTAWVEGCQSRRSTRPQVALRWREARCSPAAALRQNPPFRESADTSPLPAHRDGG